MFFNLTRYKEELNKAMKNGKIAPTTADIYFRSLIELNGYLNDGASSKEVADAIMVAGGKSAESFVTAVSFYERKVMGKSGIILSPIDRQSIKIDHHIRELDHKPSYYRKKIDQAKNRLAFTVQERSGLRVSEVSALTPKDIAIVGDDIVIRVRHGKGNKARTVHVLPSPYLLKELPKFESFPSEEALKAEATALGFRTHDLRKVNARTRYWIERENGAKKRDALREVQFELGHVKSDETKKYLGVEYEKKKNDLGY